ncbi:MAG: histidine triad nucleotide-binding protein [Parachlamydiales bacterium]|nr:histidine triad nucleotide-binding protein [Parachlamydiales bacterium]
MDTVFDQIIQGKLPAEKVYEDKNVIAIKDIAPKAPVHILIIPKKPIKDLQSITKEDLPIIEEVILVAQKLARDFNIEEGYRFLTNNGISAGQSVFHLHFHLIGGRKMGILG